MKKILSVVITLLLLASCACTCIALEHPPRLVDDAGLLKESEYSSILAKLDEISEKYDFDIVILTVDTINSEEPSDFAYDYFVNNSYGGNIDEKNGETYGDGIIFLVSMEKRDYSFVPNGYGRTAFNQDCLEYIDEKTTSYLSNGDYYESFTRFAELCDDFLLQAENGTPYTKKTLPKEPFSFAFNLVVCLIIGLVVGLISVSVMKSGMKSVKKQNTAANYVVDGSMNVTESRDTFLYRNVTRIKKPENSSRSGSGSHGGHSASHGGRSGKF